MFELLPGISLRLFLVALFAGHEVCTASFAKQDADAADARRVRRWSDLLNSLARSNLEVWISVEDVTL